MISRSQSKALEERRNGYTALVAAGIFYASAFTLHMFQMPFLDYIAIPISFFAVVLTFKGVKILSMSHNRFSKIGFCPECHYECHAGGASEPCAECGEPLSETGVVYSCCHINTFDNALTWLASLFAVFAMVYVSLTIFRSLP